MLVHLRASKMLDYLWDHTWWHDMVLDTKAFVRPAKLVGGASQVIKNYMDY